MHCYNRKNEFTIENSIHLYSIDKLNKNRCPPFCPQPLEVATREGRMNFQFKNLLFTIEIPIHLHIILIFTGDKLQSVRKGVSSRDALSLV